MSRFISALPLLFACIAATADEMVLRSTTAMARFIDSGPADPVPFSLTATVTDVEHNWLILEDDNGAVRVNLFILGGVRTGDVVRASGTLHWQDEGACRNARAERIGHVALSPPSQMPLAAVEQTANDLRRITTEGLVTDVFRDEIDPRIDFLMLRDGDAFLPVALPHADAGSHSALIGARVRVTGRFLRRVRASRTFSGPFVRAFGEPTVLTPTPADPFAAPELAFYPLLTPREIARLPPSRITGTVLAAWGGCRMLVETKDGRILHAGLRPGVGLPKRGDGVDVVGRPTTDLFRINLVQALWRENPSAARTPADAPITNLVAVGTLSDTAVPVGGAVTRLFGRLVRVVGLVSEIRSAGADLILELRCDGSTVTVRFPRSESAVPDIPIGSTVDVAGTAVFESDDWRSDRVFPHVHGLTVIPRTASDIRILSRPPWWTPGRLITIIALLAAGLLGILIWNRILNRLIVRRSRELAREQVSARLSKLKADERTRLAVELHDSLSQNLEGVACQMAASASILGDEPDRAAGFLATATQMLDSCRAELRRCLFDLRSDALDERDFTAAIRKTLEPIAHGLTIRLRFDARRARFSESQAHAVLSIIRELTSNAVRHGRAGEVQIAGECHDERLSFSIRDNGCGFEPKTRPGPAQGHFGLQGVRERIRPYGGELEIDSRPGGPTRIRVTLRLDTETDDSTT